MIWYGAKLQNEKGEIQYIEADVLFLLKREIRVFKRDMGGAWKVLELYERKDDAE